MSRLRSVPRANGWLGAALLGGMLCLVGCGDPARPGAVVVTTTLIETAVRDLAEGEIDIASLMAPGSCPSHFDLDPAQVRRVRSADLVLRHDYQASWEAGLIRGGVDPERIVALPSRPAFTIPSSYVDLCADVAEQLAGRWPEQRELLEQALDRIREEANRVEQDALLRTSHMRDRPVLAARFQRHFCEWLGLQVVADFVANVDMAPGALRQAVATAKEGEVEAVIGNLQWGERHLQAVAEAAGVPGVMLSNFPYTGEAGAYWLLFDENLQALLQMWP